MNTFKKCSLVVVGVLCVFLTLAGLHEEYFGISLYQHQRKENNFDRWTSYNDQHDDLGNITTNDVIEGPCSLRKTVRKNNFLLRTFNFSVPVFQWARSLTDWQRLGNSAPPYGWKDVPLDVVSSALTLLSNSSNSHLYERNSTDQCVRCAVVGNGGILKGSKQGRVIDSHNLVFRVNGAVTTLFKEDVGIKSSFYGFTTNTMKQSLRGYRKYGFTQIPQNPGIKYIFIPANNRDYLMIKAAIKGEMVTSDVDKGDRPSRYFGSTTAAGSFKMLHPDFITYLKQKFLNSPLLRRGKYSHLYIPSTGALMLLTALHTCDQVSAFGFITRNFADFPDHYFDYNNKPLRFYANHDMRMEGRLWDMLDKLKVMSLYQRSVKT